MQFTAGLDASSPTSFALLGSINGTAWDVILVADNSPLVYSHGQKKTLLMPAKVQAAAYSDFRFVMTSKRANTTNNGVTIGDLLLYGQQPQLPNLTSNTEPAGYVASASHNSINAWKAFDGASTTYWTTIGATRPCWLQVKYPFAVWLVGYTIDSGAYPTDAPATWEMQGSADGSSEWTTLDARDGMFIENVPQTFTVSGATHAYTYYRLYVTSVAGQPNSSYYTTICTLQLSTVHA